MKFNTCSKKNTFVLNVLISIISLILSIYLLNNTVMAGQETSKAGQNLLQETFEIKIGDYHDNLPFYPLPEGQGRFVYFNLANNSALTAAGAKAIADIFPKDDNILFVTPEASTIGLAHDLRNLYGIKGLVLSKKIRSDMDPQNVIYEEYQPITSISKTRLYLGRNEALQIKGKNVIIIDNVCTTGETIQALYHLVKRSGGVPLYAIVLFTEGEGKPQTEITTKSGEKIKLLSFGHLPIVD